MKPYLLLCFSCLLLAACSHRTAGRLSVAEQAPSQSETTPFQASTPFGCTDLIHLQYPRRWEADTLNYGQLAQPDGQDFQDIGQYYQTLHETPVIPSPATRRIVALPLEDAHDAYFDSLASKATDSCLYRLPDMGPYACYYFLQPGTGLSYGVYGNLLLLDPATQNGQVINVYFEYGGDQHIQLRYFLIDQHTIQLFEGACYDDGCELAATYVLSVHPDGNIAIEHIEE